MRNRACFLIQTATGWQLAASNGNAPTLQVANEAADSTPEDLAEQVQQFVHDNGLSQRSIVVGVHSASALAAQFEIPGAGRTPDRRQLGYCLEQSLPVAAEDLSADFDCDGDQGLGVAVRTRDFQPIVDALESQGLAVQSISPVALLAWQSFREQPASEPFDVVLWQEGAVLEFLCRRGSHTCRWLHLAAEPSGVLREVAVASLQSEHDLRVVLLNGAPDLREAMSRLTDVEIQHSETATMLEHSQRMADMIVSGTREAAFELRRGSLAAAGPLRAVAGSLRWFLVSAAMLLICSIVGFSYRSLQNRRQADAIHARQAALFREAFPNTPVPAGVVSRLQSEHAKLRGARGQSADVRLPSPALNVLYEVLVGLPDGAQFHVAELHIEDGEIDLSADLRSHGQAGTLVAALQRRGFNVSPPSTTQKDATLVTARIRGRWPVDGDREERVTP